ncbi:MAG: 50S ribosomal protein L11 methyltransferase [Prochloraceae cyanobacterium]
MSNSWWEIRIFCDLMQEESVYWRLESLDSRGTAMEVKDKHCLIRAYVPQRRGQFSGFKRFVDRLAIDAKQLDLIPPKVEWDTMDDRDWATSWKQYWQPTEIGDRLIVYPSWIEAPDSSKDSPRSVLRLDPGAAFGTGTHPTTQLCLESLEMRLGFAKTNKNLLLDIGCGSGILSIAAVLLGAKQVYAVDTDPLAVSSARANRDLNQIDSDRIEVARGSIDRLMPLKDRGVDGIVCNILAEVIIELIPQINAISNDNTWGILSGILLDKAKNVADELETSGWIVATLWKREQWCCLNIRRAARSLIK